MQPISGAKSGELCFLGETPNADNTSLEGRQQIPFLLTIGILKYHFLADSKYYLDVL